jgi:excisionase family DNA binding protein
MKEFMSVGEAAAALHVSRWTIHRAIQSKALPAWRVGKLFRIERAAVEAYAKPVGLKCPPGSWQLSP